MPAAQQLHRMLDLHMRREQQDGDIGELLADYPRRIEPLGAMRWRHPNVGHHQLRRALANEREQLPTVTGLPHHIEPRTVQQTGQTLPKQQIVIGHQHPHRNHHLPVGSNSYCTDRIPTMQD